MHTYHRVRSRGVIIHHGTLLVVKNTRGSGYYALPGGHVDVGETPYECMVRELKEELGVDAVVGRLLYVYTFVDGEGRQSVEFIFEVTNGHDFVAHTDKEKTHAHELSEVRWVNRTEDVHVLPLEVYRAFQSDSLPSETTYLKGSALDK
jgi:8-oxo-dGTP pyrophosphatase MutT (NUDIX family)